MSDTSDEDIVQSTRSSRKRCRLLSEDSDSNRQSTPCIDLTENSTQETGEKNCNPETEILDEITIVDAKNSKKTFSLLNDDGDDIIEIEEFPSKSKKSLQYSGNEEDDDLDPKAFAKKALKNGKKKKKTIIGINEDLDQSDDDDDDDCVSDLDEDLFEDITQAPQSKASQKIAGLRQQVVDFLQNSKEVDLEAIPGVSKKKVEQLLTLRPIKNWADLNRKIENHRSSSINEDIVINALATMKSREVVGKLMENCQKLAQDIGKLVDNLKEAQQPKLIPNHLKLSSYQLVGLNWLILMHNKGINAILADEMGLGKTIQVIAFLGYLRETLGIHGHFCVIVPASTIDNWEREFDTWTPEVRILQYTGSQQERANIRSWFAQHPNEVDVILTTYNFAQNSDDRRLFKKTRFEYLVYDEAHMLKNMKSNRYQNLIKIKSKHRILLTGTPVQNNLVELMSLLIFTMPKIFISKMQHIEALFGSSISKESGGRTEYERMKIEQARTIMKPFILRRLKADVLKDLPKKTEQIQLCEMTKAQDELYKNLVESFRREIIKNEQEILENDESFADVNDNSGSPLRRGAAMLMAMRRLANHKLLARDIYSNSRLREMASILCKKDINHKEANEQLVYEDLSVMHDFELHVLCKQYDVLSNFILSDDDICDSGKFRFLDELLPKYKNTKQKCLIFSQFTMMLDIMEDYLDIKEINYVRLDGTTKTSERLELIDEFNQNETVIVFLLSTKAGGLGINLTSASTVIIHDVDYNPMNDLQAQDRSYRIGQTNDVLVHKLVSKGSIEEGILNAANEKLKLGNDINGTATGNASAKDLRSLLRINLNL